MVMETLDVPESIFRRRKSQDSLSHGQRHWSLGFLRSRSLTRPSRGDWNFYGQNEGASRSQTSLMTYASSGFQRMMTVNVQLLMVHGKCLTTTLRWPSGRRSSMKMSLS
ncbi:hypothetical protein LINPERHAP2_LOCUS38688 [Linum perenne]